MDDDLRTTRNHRNGLLAMLLDKGLLRQPEVILTTSIAWLCQRPDARRAVGQLVGTSAGGLQPGDDATWLAEVRAADGTRTDLECWWGTPSAPRVVVEAKLAALLTPAQVAGYLADQTLIFQTGRVGCDCPGMVSLPRR